MKPDFFVSVNTHEEMEAYYVEQIRDLEEALAEKHERVKELEKILECMEQAAEELWDNIRRSR